MENNDFMIVGLYPKTELSLFFFDKGILKT